MSRATRAAAGGEFPSTGVYTVTRWAEMLGCDPRTIRRWVETYGIPFRKPGIEAFIDAADFLKSVPKQQTPKWKEPR